MAILYIQEYASAGLARDGHSVLQAGQEPAVASQVVAIGGTSAPSAAFNAKTKFVRLHTDVICSVLFGTTPTADAEDMRLAAGQTEYFCVRPGDKVAVIENT